MSKTIIISITTIICTLLICFTLVECSETSRYVSYDYYDYPAILDHKTGDIYYLIRTDNIAAITKWDLINGQKNEKYVFDGITVERIQAIRELTEANISGEALENELSREKYFEKVENGTNTRSDDRRAELNGWLD